MCIEHDRNNLKMRVFHLPRMKTTREGEDVTIAGQNGPSDPESAFLHHLQVNNPPLGSTATINLTALSRKIRIAASASSKSCWHGYPL
jgi:hypothetical protein